MPSELSVSPEQFDKMKDSEDVIRVDHDTQPDEVANRFIKAIEAAGGQVEIFYPRQDVPTLLYRISFIKKD